MFNVKPQLIQALNDDEVRQILWDIFKEFEAEKSTGGPAAFQAADGKKDYGSSKTKRASLEAERNSLKNSCRELEERNRILENKCRRLQEENAAQQRHTRN